LNIVYDFQDSLKNINAGKFIENDFVSIRRDASAEFSIIEIEDIKALQITERENREGGIFIDLKSIEGVAPGDRLTITGRVGENAPAGQKWSVALFRVSETHSPHLAHHPAPRPLFVLSYVLEKDDLDATLTLHSISWGSKEPDMDMFIDEILITRNKSDSDFQIDPREKIYSLAQDENLEPQLTKLYDENGDNPDLLINGGPNVRVFLRNDAPAIHVSNRVHDWDGVDICLENFKLIPGNKYKVTANIHLDDVAPLGTIFNLQGIPGFDWRGDTVVHQETDFTLEYVLNRAEVEKWRSMRITTNPPGASVSFYIYSIEVDRL